jgi:hypothetical protein
MWETILHPYFNCRCIAGSVRLHVEYNISSRVSGSSQNLLGSNKLLNMQEDARSRRISAEVMKHRLYESVIVSPRHRRLSMRADGDLHGDGAGGYNHPSRMAMSMPVTPAHSHNVTPQHSPTSSARRFQWPGWFSRGTTPLAGTTPTDDQADGSIMEVEEDSWKGLACLFKPQPKYVPAGRWSRNVENEEQEMDIEGRRTSPVQDCDNGMFLRDVPKRQKRSPSPPSDDNEMA